MSSNKKIFHNLQRQEYIPLFFRSHYLDAIIKDKSWDVIIDGKDVWVYLLKKKWGIKYIITPQLVPYLGYWSFDDQFDIDRYQKLKSKLPHHHVFIDNLHHRYNKINNNKYTYIIANQDADVAFTNMKTQNRRYIRKSTSQLNILNNTDYSVFASTVVKSFSAKSRDIPYDMKIMERLENALSTSKNRTIYSSVDDKKETTAVLYIVYDEKTAYYLASAHLNNDHSLYALIWSAIKWAMETGRNFDFEGSMIPGVERFFKGFGGKKTFYPYVYEASNPIIDRLVKLKNPNIDI